VPGWLTLTVDVEPPETTPGPVQLYVTGVVVVLATAPTVVSVQFRTPADDVTEGVAVF
ncbi:UNVERIFIED_CONTAM: hypothetical protein IGO34_24095, partial [Salmonella enterica subsp. enterica serovar Weltevreden]